VVSAPEVKTRALHFVGQELGAFVAAADAADSRPYVLDGDDGAVVPELAWELLSEVLHEAPMGGPASRPYRPY
jgi:hypothetical protein